MTQTGVNLTSLRPVGANLLAHSTIMEQVYRVKSAQSYKKANPKHAKLFGLLQNDIGMKMQTLPGRKGPAVVLSEHDLLSIQETAINSLHRRDTSG